MKNSTLNPFSSLRGAKRSKHRGNLQNLDTPYTAPSKCHPEATAEGSAKLVNCADSSLPLRMTEKDFEFLIQEAL